MDHKHPHPYLMFAVLVNVFFTIFPVGYEAVILNIPQKLVESFVNASFVYEYGYQLGAAQLTTLWSFTVATQSIGAPFGCIIAVAMTKRCGRNLSLMILNNLFVITGSLLMAFCRFFNCFEMLLAGRFIMGLSTGVAYTVLPLYLSEICPPLFRGKLSCLEHIALSLGNAVGAIMGLPKVFGTVDFWPYLLGFPVFVAVVQMLFFPVFPGSPKYLYTVKKQKDKAIQSVLYYYGPRANIERVFAYFEYESSVEKEQLSIRTAVTDPTYLRPILLGALINFAEIFTGMMSLEAYSTYLFSTLGVSYDESQYATAAICSVFVIMSLPPILMVEKIGRRMLLLSNLGAVAVCLFMLLGFGLVLDADTSKVWAIYAFMAVFLALAIAYNMGPGPLAYFLAGELSPEPVRSVALAVGVAVNWLSTVVAIFAFYPLYSLIGSYSFLMFALPTLAAFVLLYCKLPETRPSLRFSLSLYDIAGSENNGEMEKLLEGLVGTDDDDDLPISTTGYGSLED